METTEGDVAGLDGTEGMVRVGKGAGRGSRGARAGNPLYDHGPLRMNAAATHLEHEDGTPSFWLADTWWMGLSDRLRWPRDFRRLAADRASRGFTTVLIVAGLYPDMPAVDPRSRNEAGHAWQPGFDAITPAYFDAADRRIAALVDAGLVPCIVGAWGLYTVLAGTDTMLAHWRNLVARWGAYPVVWCIAGEALMAYYETDEWKGYARLGLHERMKYLPEGRCQAWSDVARSVRATDSFSRPLTIHPTRVGRAQLDDPTLLDFEMLQTGHMGLPTLADTVDMIEQSRRSEPQLPCIVGECNYEGEGASSGPEVQRYLFWMAMLTGAFGHTYGAEGIWQVNRPQRAYGPSPHGMAYGQRSWQEAMRQPGAAQVGAAARFLGTLPWWRIEPHPEWVTPRHEPGNRLSAYAAGIPGELVLVFVPLQALWSLGLGNMRLGSLEQDVTYRVTFFDPVTGTTSEAAAPLHADATGVTTLPQPPLVQDWVLLVERADADRSDGAPAAG